MEDNPSDVNLLRLALTEQGDEFEIHVCTDGQQAVDFVQAQEHAAHDQRPCVAILDLHLPKHNGIEVLRALRKEPATSHIHVVVLTSSLRARDASEIQVLGAHCRPKPTMLSELTELAAHVMAMCKSSQVPA
ncbi:MAG: response regulator [Bryobacterales bacterium]|nr:response regulator [Bryobacterales bacterium]